MTIISIFRGEIELMAVQISISFFVNVFAVLPIVYLLIIWSQKKNRIAIINNAVSILVFAIVANNFIAISKLFVPNIYDILMALQVQNESMSESISVYDAYRLGGWGENLVFSGGTSSALGIMLSMYKYCKSHTKIEKSLFVVTMLFILFSGILIARTTLIGLPLAVIVLIHYVKNVKYFIQILFVTIFVCLVTIILFIYISSQLDDKMGEWAFELIYNFLDEGDISSDSSDELKNMWKIVPTNIVTWLIGDGFFKTSTGSYYKGTDVGVMRIVFFIGIIGLSAILTLFRAFLYKKNADKDTKALLNALFIWFVIMNIKGVFIPVHVVCLFSVILNIKIRKNKKLINYEQAKDNRFWTAESSTCS